MSELSTIYEGEQLLKKAYRDCIETLFKCG